MRDQIYFNIPAMILLKAKKSYKQMNDNDIILIIF